MTRKAPRVAFIVTCLAALAAAVAVPAFAANQKATACGPLAKWKVVFPTAPATDFAARWPIAHHSGRRNHWDGTCGGWATTYTDYRGAARTQEALSPTRDFAQVSLVVFSSRAAARAAYAQSIPTEVLSPVPAAGALMRSGVSVAIRDGREDGGTATVVSLVNEIVVISVGEGRPPDNSGAKARREQERIHQAIHRNVLAMR